MCNNISYMAKQGDAINFVGIIYNKCLLLVFFGRQSLHLNKFYHGRNVSFNYIILDGFVDHLV